MSIPTGYLLGGIDRAIIPGMDKYEIRRMRVAELIKRDFKGVHAAFAKQIDRDPSYVGRMLYKPGKKGRKNISDKLIDVIETKLNLAAGWLDGIEVKGTIDALTEDQKKILDLAGRMELKVRENWMANGEFLANLIPTYKAESEGIEGRAEHYDAENIRRGDNISNEERLQKRKNNGDPI